MKYFFIFNEIDQILSDMNIIRYVNNYQNIQET